MSYVVVYFIVKWFFNLGSRWLMFCEKIITVHCDQLKQWQEMWTMYKHFSTRKKNTYSFVYYFTNVILYVFRLKDRMQPEFEKSYKEMSKFAEKDG